MAWIDALRSIFRNTNDKKESLPIAAPERELSCIDVDENGLFARYIHATSSEHN